MRDTLLIIVGLSGIYAELIRPGKVIPGVTGGVLLMLGIKGMLDGPVNARAALTLGTPFAALTIALVAIAWRARRNKLKFD